VSAEVEEILRLLVARAVDVTYLNGIAMMPCDPDTTSLRATLSPISVLMPVGVRE
jgi:hypothetical protein